MGASENTQVRVLEGRRNADMVLAESALRAERVVAVVRPLLFVLFGLSQGLLRQVVGTPLPPDIFRQVAVGSYAVFCVVAFLSVRRAAPDPRAAERWPLFLALVDFTFSTVMGWRSVVNQGFLRPDLTAAAGAALLAFSAGRMGWHHVAFSTVLAIASYAITTSVAGMWDTPFGLHVTGSYISLGLLLGWFNHERSRMFLELRRRDTLSRLLPGQVVERLLRMDGALLPSQREVTVLFSDLRDFTTLSEKREPAALLALLDEYFSAMSQVVKGHDGMVNKYLGDGMLAVWNAPNTTEDHADRALKAALDMERALAELNASFVARGLPALRMGVGIHTGTVAAGMMGGVGQQEYAVIGDAVNLASRVEGLTKGAGVTILVTSETHRRLKHPERCRALGDHNVKGRGAPVAVFTPG